MYKIYFDNKPLFLSSEIGNTLTNWATKNIFFVEDISTTSVRVIINDMQKEKYAAGIVLHPDADHLLSLFKKEFVLIKAAGGLVSGDNNTILLIFRRGTWDLPKGKLDEGETLEACAVREVEEETGLKSIGLGQKITTTYHTYVEKGKHILKESHWFLMHTKGTETLKPQTEEDIEKCEWADPRNLHPYLSNIHAAIIDVLNDGTNMLEKGKEHN